MPLKVLFPVFGPPASGKSTICRLVTDLLPNVAWLAIDDFRTGSSQDEPMAWHLFTEAILDRSVTHEAILIESAGVSWQMEGILLSDSLNSVPQKTVKVIADWAIVQRRLHERHMEERYSPGLAYMEAMFQEWCYPTLVRRACDLTLDTSAGNIEVSASTFKEFILRCIHNAAYSRLAA